MTEQHQCEKQIALSTVQVAAYLCKIISALRSFRGGTLLTWPITLGLQRTLTFFRQRFWWSSMEEITQEFVAAFPIFSQHRGLLHPMPVSHRPWSHTSLDVVSGLPSSEGNTVILSVVERF